MAEMTDIELKMSRVKHSPFTWATPGIPNATTWRLPKAKEVSILQVDCFDYLRSLEPGSVDLLVTSPPYAMSKKYDEFKSWDAYKRWIGAWFEEVCRVLHPTEGNLFFNFGCPVSDSTRPFQVAILAESVGLKLQNTIAWVKAFDQRGHFTPVSSDYHMHSGFEHIFHLTRSGKVRLDRKAIGVPYADKSNAARWASNPDGIRCRGNVWFIDHRTIQDRDKQRGGHEATFPEELPRRCINLVGKESIRLMVDPFLGSGTSAVAAVLEGVNFVGCERDPGFFRSACERVDEAFTRLEELESCRKPRDPGF